EADHGDPLALRDVLDDGVEHRVHRLACCCPAEISRLCCDLHEIRLRYYMSHLYSPAFLRSIVAKPKRKHNEVAHALAQAFMITREEARSHVCIPQAGGGIARRCARHGFARADHAHLLELGAADAPSDGLAGEL